MSIINAEVGPAGSQTFTRRGLGSKRTCDVVVSTMLLFALPAMFFIAVIMFFTDRGRAGSR